MWLATISVLESRTMPIRHTWSSPQPQNSTAQFGCGWVYGTTFGKEFLNVIPIFRYRFYTLDSQYLITINKQQIKPHARDVQPAPLHKWTRRPNHHCCSRLVTASNRHPGVSETSPHNAYTPAITWLIEYDWLRRDDQNRKESFFHQIFTWGGGMAVAS